MRSPGTARYSNPKRNNNPRSSGIGSKTATAKRRSDARKEITVRNHQAIAERVRTPRSKRAEMAKPRILPFPWRT